MSIHRHSRFATHLSSRRTRGAFTLIELLVVVAIIALLISILLPSLRGAREAARAVVCGQRMRDLGNGMQTYFTEHKDWIPSVNAAGVSMRSNDGITANYYNPRMPVQSWDWITPCISPSVQMQPLRAKRFKEILTEFSCPSQRMYNTILYPPGLSACADKADFQADPTGWIPLSFLMPVHFQYWGTNYKDLVIGTHKVNSALKIKALTTPNGWETTIDNYKAMITQVGAPSAKIAAADGTRYLDQDLTLDFDPDEVPNFFGSFTAGGAWWSGDVAYGVRPGSQTWGTQNASPGSISRGANIELSYRHGSGVRGQPTAARDNRGTINAMFFDGSVRRLNDRESRNPVLWYPRGSVVKGASQGMTDDLVNEDRIP